MKIKLNIFWKKKTKEKIKSENKVNDLKVEKQNSNVQNTNLKVYTKDNIIKYNFKENVKPKLENEEVQNLRKVRKKRQHKQRGAYFLFLGMIVLACYSVYFSYSKYRNYTEEDYAVYNSEEVEEVIIEPTEEQSSISNNYDTIQKQETTTKEVSTNVTKTQVKKVEPLEFARPIDGEVLKIFSSDKVIYSKTLELWKTHDGIDIKSEENTIVKSIEKGIVEKIYDDSFYGKTIVIDHGQGYKSSYSNLSEEVFVKEKQVVTKLAKIGKIGKTAIGEIKDESHLHFTLIKNNEICDPTSIFK